jgi:hypothetical protein
LLELLQDLLPYLGAFYVLDSLLLVRPGGTAFASRGARFETLAPGLHVIGLLPSDQSIVLPAGGAEAMDVARVRTIRDLQAHWSLVVQGCGWLMLAGLGIAIPMQVLGWWTSDVSLARQCAALAVVWAVVVGACGYQLRSAGLRGGALVSALSGLVFFPPAAAHASCVLGRYLYAGLHPLAVAAVVLDGERFRQLARRYHYEGRLRQGEDDSAALRPLNVSLEDVLRHPRSSDPTAAGYCPLCAAEYRAGYSRCSDCGEPLQPLAA